MLLDSLRVVEADGNVKRPYIIAELSANHMGSLERALAIVEAAAEAGADAVKLQTWTPGTMVGPKDYALAAGPWKGRLLEDLYQEAWLPWAWHETLFKRAHSLGIEAFSSAFDPESVAFLESLRVPRYKIASFELPDAHLIQVAAATGKPLILSTGMASKDEIHMAVQFARAAGCKELTLLKCTSAYPARPEDANLATMRDMWASFGCEVGLSDHTLSPATAIAATAMGAAAIEKHLTLKRSDGGPDAGFSLEPWEFAAMAQACRQTADAMGGVKYGPSQSEAAQVCLRRSLYLVKDVRAGEPLRRSHVRSARPALGMSPLAFAYVEGRPFVEDVKAGTPLLREMLRCSETATRSV